MIYKNQLKENLLKKADWELDFYSRPIIDANGKKRWELLISSTENFSGEEPFRWEKICPAEQVNSKWLTVALNEALKEAQLKGWECPARIRFWRTSMKTMVKKSAESLGIDVIESRRTYSLIQWLKQRKEEIYPNEPGYMAGPIALPITPIINQSIPLPEAVRGDAWSIATLPLKALKEAQEWPMEFSGLIPLKNCSDESIDIPGIRLFSQARPFALAAWLGGLEPVKIVLEKNQLILEAGQEERWLITDVDQQTADFANQKFATSKEKANGLQFISVQSNPEEERFTGFWMLRDLNDE
tara:strand:+ start:13535 stop:14431 length:897 start_codon:yes stop_codon:yes gene_type:complete